MKQRRRHKGAGRALAAGGALLLLGATGLIVLFGGTAPRPAAGTGWALTGTDGTPVRITALPGRLRLVYFGYTSCPDICPTTLAAISGAIRLLGGDGARIVPVFITIDPARDRPALLARYVRGFSPMPIALTGSAAAISAVEHRYGIHVTRHEGTIDHDAAILLLSDDGGLLAAWPIGLTPAALAGRLWPYVGGTGRVR